MKLSKRIETLEERWFVGKDDAPEAVFIYLEDKSKSGVPVPITRMTSTGMSLDRLPLESFPNFKSRAIEQAKKHLTSKYAVPVIIANGSLEET